MKKILTYGVLVVIVALGAYFLFFRGSGGLKVEEVTTTKSGNSSSVSKSSTSKTPTVGLVIEKGDLKVTVSEVLDDQVSFTAQVTPKDSTYCVPGSTTKTFDLKKGEKLTLSDCTNSDKTYNVSF